MMIGLFHIGRVVKMMHRVEIPMTTLGLGRLILEVMLVMAELLTMRGTGGDFTRTVISEMTFGVEVTMIGP